MDDVAAMLSQVLSDPAAMERLQSVAASLGLGGGENPGEEPPPEAAEQTAAPPAPDLSALSGILGGLMGNSGQQSQPAPQNGAAALAALLNGGGASSGQGAGQSQAPGLPFDMGTLLKLRQAMSSLQSNQANVQLLMALKPRLRPDRAKKVDDAVRVMQLIQFLPLIKESGLFGELGSGGLGGVVSGLGDGLGNMLGGLFGGRRG